MPWQPRSIMSEKTDFVLRAQHTDNFAALCAEFGISRKTGYKWVSRFAEGGTGALEDQSRRPRSCSSIGEDALCRIVELRKHHPQWGARKIQACMQRPGLVTPSESTIKRILEKCGLLTKRRFRRVQPQSQRIHHGYRATEPGEVHTIDFKGWKGLIGRRVVPLTIRDEFSRYVLKVQGMVTHQSEAVRAVLEECFREHGLPKAIRSDNGPPFAAMQGLMGLTRLSAWWLVLGIDLERGRPGHPQDNGAHERMHRDLQWRMRNRTTADLEREFEVWRREFNEERPHEALQMRPPAKVYRPSPRRFEGTPDEILYGPEMKRLRVTKGGYVVLRRQSFFLSLALKGWHVGLQEEEQGVQGVYFTNLRLGEIDPKRGDFRPAEWTRPARAPKSE